MALEALGSALYFSRPPLPNIYIRLDVDDPFLEETKNNLLLLCKEYQTNCSILVGPHTIKGNVPYLNDAAKAAYLDGSDLIVQLDDDQSFRTPYWNNLYCDAAAKVRRGIGVLATESVENDSQFVRPPSVTRRWYEIYGSFYCSDYIHFCADTEINEIAHEANKFFLVPGVEIKHNKIKDATAKAIRNDKTRLKDGLTFESRKEIRKHLVMRMVSE